MKKVGFTPLKSLLLCILTGSVIGLASLGASLARDRKNFEKLQSGMEQRTETMQEKETLQKEMTAKKDAAVKKETVPKTEGDFEAGNDYKAEAAEQPDTGENSFVSGKEEFSVPQEKSADPGFQNAERFAPLIAYNADFAGWLTIEGTKIDYPVMLSPDDPDFYLTHDFDKKKSKSGVPYIGKNCDTDSDNTIIYAHNMKNGTMFSGLLKYAEEAFYRKHSVICFDTPKENGNYEIIAVFREKVHYQDETDVFRYYNYCGKLTEAAFQDYITRIKEISLYETGKTAEYGQKLITLSTCSYHTENGRFVVVAVKDD